MEEKDFKKLIIALIVILLIALVFVMLKPIAISVFLGFLLAYIFHPLFKKLKSKLKNGNLCAGIILGGILLIILLPAVLFLPYMIGQLINAYVQLKSFDISPVLRELMPALFETAKLQTDTLAITSSITSNLAELIFSTVKQLAYELPTILIHLVIVLFTFYFALRDLDDFKAYIISISPFPKEYQDRIIKKFGQVTNSVIYGQVVTGIIQGLIAGIGYIIFGAPNALLLTIFSIILSILPIVGAWLVWVPVDAYFFMTGHTNAGVGMLLYGLIIVSWVDNIVRPIIVSRLIKMNSGIVLVGMVGGLYVFGISGLVLGPLLLAYLLLFAEFYKEKSFKSILVEEPKPEAKAA